MQYFFKVIWRNKCRRPKRKRVWEKTPINKTLPFGSQKVFCFENASKDIILREGPKKGSQGQFYILQKNTTAAVAVPPWKLYYYAGRHSTKCHWEFHWIFTTCNKSLGADAFLFCFFALMTQQHAQTFFLKEGRDEILKIWALGNPEMSHLFYPTLP